MGGAVALVRTQSSVEDIRSSISKALDLIDFKLDCPVESVTIKPNLCYYWDAATGYTTDPQVVAGVVEIVRERFGADVDIKLSRLMLQLCERSRARALSENRNEL